MPKRRRSADTGAPPRGPMEWLGSVRRLPMLQPAGGMHAPWIVVWYAPKHGVLQIAVIPRGKRSTTIRDTLLTGIRRAGSLGAPLELRVDAAQLHREASEAFPSAKVFVHRDSALEYALRTPQALEVLAELARTQQRARLSLVDGGLSTDSKAGSATTEDRAADGDEAVGTRPAIARVLRLVRDETSGEDSSRARPASGGRGEQPVVALALDSWRRADDDGAGHVATRARHPDEDPPSVDDDARTPRELVAALAVDRHVLSTVEFALESVAFGNLALVASFRAWDEGHAHGDTIEDEGERPLDLVLELLATHQCATIVTMNVDDLEEVLFEHLPSHADFTPDRASEIVGELQRFARFLEREAAHRLAPPLRRLLADTATTRLRKALAR